MELITQANYCDYCNKRLKKGSKSIFCDSRCRVYQSRYYKGQPANPYQTYSLDYNNIYVQELIEICNKKNAQNPNGNSVAEQTLRYLETGHYGKISQGDLNYLENSWVLLPSKFDISNLF
jgi:hypothetical protein